MFDSYNREISYLRISVTDFCNLRCTYCMPPDGVTPRPRREFLSYEAIAAIAREAAGLGITQVRLTGGEPLVKRDITVLLRLLKAIPGVREVALTTNGTLLAPLAGPLKEAGLDRINVSLDTLDPIKYREITRGGDIRDALRGIEAALGAGFRNTKINMVLIPGVNDEAIDEMAAFCRRKGLVLQRIHHYSLRDRGEAGDPLDAERPHACAACNRIRLTADGKLKPCLFSDAEIPVDLADIRTSLQRAIRGKPERGRSCTVRGIWQIGG
jgi:cyclic pyranopterin phosphate synthase